MVIGFIVDLVVGVDNGGSQVWSYQDEIVVGLIVGVLLDCLVLQGQNWGLGVFLLLVLCCIGYCVYLFMLCVIFVQGGGICIDYVFGLNCLWLVLQGREVDVGVYVFFFQQDMLCLIVLEFWCYWIIVIGEDLGIVLLGFDIVLDEVGVFGICVFWFQCEKMSFLLFLDWLCQVIVVMIIYDLLMVVGWWFGVDLVWCECLG